jgi:hypothetical protein
MTEERRELPELFDTAFSSMLRDLTRARTLDSLERFKFLESANRRLDDITPSVTVPVSRHLIETVRISNRIASFVLDGARHFGTGILVGPAHVLTAAHLFFDERGRPNYDRLNRVKVEGRTTFFSDIMKAGPPWTANLSSSTPDQCFVEPKIVSGAANRELDRLDFAILTLDERVGEASVGAERRRWVDIPAARSAQVLSADLVIRAFQFLDRKELLASSGCVREITVDGMRVLHTASTADSASGAAIVDDEFNLVALHLAGPASGEYPKANHALPIARVAEIIDQVRTDGTTARSELR